MSKILWAGVLLAMLLWGFAQANYGSPFTRADGCTEREMAFQQGTFLECPR